MDAALVRAFLRSLADRDDEERTPSRARAYLEALGRPDMRYLVGIARGGGAATVIRYARAVLVAAGASVLTADDQLDDPLLARGGSAVGAIAYQLASGRPDLGELSRREAEALIVLVAAAEANRRVLLVRDEHVAPFSAFSGLAPEVVSLAQLSDDALERVVADLPDATVAVLAARRGVSVDAIEAAARERGVTLVIGGRDFIAEVEPTGETMRLVVGDERYAALALGRGDDVDLAATGIVAALALGTFGVRMRPEWVEGGARNAAAREWTP